MPSAIVRRVIARRRASISSLPRSAANTSTCAHTAPLAASRRCASAEHRRSTSATRAVEIAAGRRDRPRVAAGVGAQPERAREIGMRLEVAPGRGRAQRAGRARPRGRERDAARAERGVDLVVVPVGQIGRARRARARRAASTARRATSPSIVGRSAASKSAPAVRRDELEERAEQSRLAAGEAEGEPRVDAAPPRSRARARGRAARGSPTGRARRRCAARTAARRRSGRARPPSARARERAGVDAASSSGRSHAACDGAYFECVESTSMRSPRRQELGDARGSASGWSACTTTSTSSPSSIRYRPSYIGPPTSATRSFPWLTARSWSAP